MKDMGDFDIGFVGLLKRAFVGDFDGAFVGILE
jgi:hypothetical protein